MLKPAADGDAAGDPAAAERGGGVRAAARVPAHRRVRAQRGVPLLPGNRLWVGARWPRVVAWGCAQLAGCVPASVARLRLRLRVLCLDHNALAAQLGLQAGLVCLNLSNNKLRGNIPSELGALAPLKFLFLDQNLLDGNIPSAIGRLASLEKLFLDKNNLSGSIPASIGNLKNLHSLNLSHNCLHGNIPVQLADLPNLHFCKLANNNLDGPIPPQLGHLSKLQAFYVNNNSLSGEIPASLGNLWQFNFSHNAFSGRVPVQLRNFSFINYFSVAGNPLLDKRVDSALADNERLWLFLSDQGFYTEKSVRGEKSEVEKGRQNKVEKDESDTRRSVK
ncbi:hypothetical protein HK100_002106 [Physocladia obscura]|uniref:Uncharacterized protein n=1 Tax=Physocladia obscura TaxID=109957 RepID=A0AAD5XG86_9FUNG|nr:hypothetical protein HK100_002106 [Physocladia obscura]